MSESMWVAVLCLCSVVLAAGAELQGAAGQRGKLQIKMYYSSMCPFSKRYLKNNLGSALQAEVVIL